MSMRITQSMMTARVLGDLRSDVAATARTQAQVSSGKKIARPSDDPLGTRDAISRRTELESLAQYRRNAGEAASRLDATDSALQSVSQITQRVRELTVQGGNDSTGANGRAAIAKEIDQLIESAKAAVNVKVGDAYVFSGTASTTPPYASPADTFQGNGAAVVRQVGPGVSIDVGVSADFVLGSGGGDGRLLDTLRSIKAHLLGGTPADANALRGTDLAALDANVSTVTDKLAVVGARRNLVDAADARLVEAQGTTTQLLSDVEDVDYADALMRLSSQQSAYQAALHAGAQILQPSLMDFLR